MTGGVDIQVHPAAALTDEQRQAWSAIQEAHPALGSPYFCPEFTQAVASVRDDVYVALLCEAGEIVGFFPFQRGRFGAGLPVGGALSDYHGVVADPSVTWDAESLLRACGLANWTFGYLPVEQSPFARHVGSTAECHYMDLSGGYAGYVERLRKSGSHLIKDMRYKKRRLEREFADVRFVPHVEDPSVLDTLLRWKSEQYRASDIVDVFSVAWTRALLKRIHATQTAAFAGRLSALYVGDELAAVHMGMRSRWRWNWWFPRHSRTFAKHSPGILLRVLVAEHAAEEGVGRVDLGLGGEDTYKPRLASGVDMLAQGRVEVRSMVNSAYRLYRSTEAWLRRSPLAGVARIPGRWVKRIERRMRVR